MKQLTFFFFGLLMTATLSAQHETLFNQANVIGAFGAPITEYGLRNSLGTSAGGGGALVINSFFIGAYGLGSVDFNQLFDDGRVEVVDIGHGGFWLGGTFQPYRLIHAYGSARIGWGGINIDVDDTVRYRDLDKIFVVTPEIGLELNVTSWFRVAGTVGYRYVSGINDNNNLRNEDFSGATAAVTLRFGWFGRRRN